MRSLVEHAPSGLLLDFIEQDFGGPEQAAIIQAWRDGWRPDPGDLVCVAHRNHERPWLYLKTNPGSAQMIAAHWPGTGLAGSHEIRQGVPSPQHQRQAEYIGRAAEAPGREFRREVWLPTKVRPDAVIYGDRVTVGVEVQRSHLTARDAKGRTTKARNAGVQSVWFADSRRDPAWFGYVPGVKMNPDTSWASLPGRHTVTVVSGVRSLVPRRCRDFYNNQCSKRFRGCNAWHPDHEALPLWVDDLAEQMPAGALVPVRFLTLSGREQVLIFTEADKARYEELAGQSADLRTEQRRERGDQPDRRIDCTADAGGLVAKQLAQPALLLFELPDPAPDRDGRRFTR